MSDRKTSYSESSSYTNLDGRGLSAVNAHFDADSRDWQSRMTPEEKEGVQRYTGSTYEDMNQLLRVGRDPDWSDYRVETLKKLIENCEKGVDKFRLKENMQVYRFSGDSLLSGLGISFKYGESPSAFVKRINEFIGSVVTDKGFTSTSVDKNVWSGKIRYDIKVPKGTSAAYVGHISLHKSEKELLLNRGTSYRITGAHVENGKPVVEMEIYRESSGKKLKQVRHAGTISVI